MFFKAGTGPATSEKQSGALVIFTRVEGLLRERTDFTKAGASDPLRFLAGHGVPIVLVSGWDASVMRQLQDQCEFRQPFICEEGAALHVPRTWLNESAVPNSPVDNGNEWEVFRFSPRSIGAAFELVNTMFMARGYDPLLTVGIGCDLADYALLAAVDVPIVVRGEDGRQPELLQCLPGVFVTTATGAAGWSEAVLGTSH